MKFVYKTLLSPEVLLNDNVLNNLGNDGWELVSVMKDENVVIRGARQIGVTYIYFFRKPDNDQYFS